MRIARLAGAALAVLLAVPAWSAERMPAGDARVLSMGRTLGADDGSVRFAYPGVSLRLAFEGKRLTMVAAGARGQNYLDVLVDDQAVRTIRLSPEMETITLVEAASAARHTVEIVNRSETWHGVATVRQFATDGAWKTPAALPARKLLVLGDSITCGEAIDRVPGANKVAAWWNPRASYGMLVAQALRAQVQLVCYGGRGLVRTWDGKTDQLNLPDYYGMAIADAADPAPWDQGRYRPDLILSAIGTNDFSSSIPDRAQYVQAYVKLVKTMLGDHPQARIALTEGVMLTGDKRAALISYIGETVRLINDPRVLAISSGHYAGDAVDAHPTKAQHAQMAHDLLPSLRLILGWPKQE
ncbi:MAG: bifunctional acetylxylan esterase/glucomannan deacetylase AxeC2 [Pseudomonadota bacterium]